MARTWQVILATVVIFVAGLVTGGATAFGIVRWVGHHRAMNPGALVQGSPRTGQAMQFGLQQLRRLESQLDLTDEQKARIAPIVGRTADELGRDRREVQLRTALAIEKMQDDVAEILTPEQRAKFEGMVVQQRARFQQLRRGLQHPPAQGDRPAEPGAPK
jgi:Spy/CpxP family protein refolding chaperone